ncbi:HEAT repeat domain-containing protein [Nitrospirillum sp. BR 11163]|uniref:HEAT repeat domain-containing protein n=1 Tax=Nitrospirillum sp. BR 11163 TaxID=3104323 RepID=UPI002B001A52|nr:HEAT repeat domain-containing protein [Nitrospirillum sp. BR 11163]MEA1674312.1 HEAT repeat domain-containing protein [Nitrospirillum sp. BR 11163]
MPSTSLEINQGDLSAIDSLIEAALEEMRRDDDRTPALLALQGMGTPQGLARILDLSRSPEPMRRRLAAVVLGQIHAPGQRGDGRAFPEPACDALLHLLEDGDPSVMVEAIFALGHLGNRRCDPALAARHHHEDPHVRYAIAFALCGSTTAAAVETLLALMEDPYDQVRDWATTGIGQCVELDGPDIRAALLRRIGDEDVFTRAEAMHGLARRRDARGLSPLITALGHEHLMPHLFVDAALAYLGLAEEADIPEGELLARLRALLEGEAP